MGLLAFAALFAWTASAQAFSGPDMYAVDADTGGGGGRFFTGSALDGYSCKVCHRGGPTPSIHVAGLPLDGYVPGQKYEVKITWANPEISHALNLEFVSTTGQPVRTLELVDGAMLTNEERCDQAADGESAAYLLEDGARSIVGVSDCRAAALRFFFTAPQDPKVDFSLAMVLSDSMGTPEGDGVLTLRQALRRSDVPAEAPEGGCNVRPTGRAALAPLLWFVLVVAGLLWLRRAHRRQQR